MKAKLLYQENSRRTFRVSLEKGESVARSLSDFATQKRLSTSQFTAQGQLDEVTFQCGGNGDAAEIRIPAPVEVIDLHGRIYFHQGKPVIASTVVVGKNDGSAHGGRFKDAQVAAGVDLLVVEIPRYFTMM